VVRALGDLRLAVVWTRGAVALGALDRMDDRPPYHQIADQTQGAIECGKLRPGDKLPSEAALTNYYHVARMTARQAIQGTIVGVEPSCP
jgi:Bacterial regulatory proteins, gntR family